MSARRLWTSRKGVTLLELMLVLGIITLLMAMAWPAFEGMLATHRLQSGAEQLRNLVREGRRQAIADGLAYRVDILPETGAYRLVLATDPLNEPVAEEELTGLASGDSAEEDVFEPLRLEQELPVGVQLLSSEMLLSWREVEESEELVGTEEAEAPEEEDKSEDDAPSEDGVRPDQPSQELSSEDWMPWMELWPDGSALPGVLYLVNDRRQYVEVTVDGLTGEVEVSAVQIAEQETDEEDLMAAHGEDQP